LGSRFYACSKRIAQESDKQQFIACSIIETIPTTANWKDDQDSQVLPERNIILEIVDMYP
jgi:hypothetical protein